MDPSEMLSNTQFVALLIAAIQPLIVGYLTKPSWAGKYKSYLLIALSIVNGLVAEWLSQGSGFNLKQAIFSIVLAFLTGQTAHRWIYVPTELKDKIQALGVKDKTIDGEVLDDENAPPPELPPPSPLRSMGRWEEM